jgi:phosphonate transport system substrate-binding protein
MKKIVLSFTLLLAFALNACAASSGDQAALVIGAIPDQDPELLQRRFGLLSDYLQETLGIPVEYQPVTDYTASVTAFRVGDLDLVWFGGLTGVQARIQVDGAQALLQRTQDSEFHSVFIANSGSGLEPLQSVEDLAQLIGLTFTFGSDSSTSGRLMPQYYLSQAGVDLEDLAGEPGFSGSHDATIDLVEAGSYQVGVLNQQVWLDRVEAGEVDLDRVQVIWTTPPFHDYHWVIRPGLSDRFGDEFIERLVDAFLALDPANPEHKAILDLFSAEAFILTENNNYIQIETIARSLGRIQ